MNEVLTLWNSPIICHPSLGILVDLGIFLVWSFLVLFNLVFLGLLLQESAQEPQGKYMHHTHVYDDLLLLHILFARGIHKHEGTSHFFLL